MAVISSINVVLVSLKNFKDVNTKKQKPRKLEAEFKICPDLLFLSFADAMKIFCTSE